MASETPTAPAAPLADLQAELESARADLLSSIADLRSQATGAALAERAGKAVKGWFTDAYGSPRIDRIAIVGGVVLGVIALRALGRRR